MAVFYIGSTMVANIAGNFPYEVVSSLPTASASTVGVIYVLTGENGSTLHLTAESSGSYSWVQVGSLSTSFETIAESEIDALFV